MFIKLSDISISNQKAGEMNTINTSTSNNINPKRKSTNVENKNCEIKAQQKDENSEALLKALEGIASFTMGSVLNTDKTKPQEADDFDMTNNISKNIRNFASITDPNFDDVIKSFPFDSFETEGLPLKYPRKNFINDINEILNEIPKENRTSFLKKFNLEPGYGDIDGIATIDDVVIETDADSKMIELIKKFYQNEVMIEDTKAKNVFDSLLKDFPEFCMAIGKQQHGTHAYSVDIHTFSLIQKAIQHPDYSKLSNEGKEILKISALMHDFGKRGNTVTPGHAFLSTEYAQKILKHIDLAQSSKERIINQVKNHHWFEKYNTRQISRDDFTKIFPNIEDRIIAILIAKGDFESVNPIFHLYCLKTGYYLPPTEYEKKFNEITSELVD